MSDLIIRPNGDSSPLELSCSSGTTHYTLIDEAVADDSDYVFYSGTHSAIDYYTFENHTTETGVIAGIIMYARCTGSANIYFRVYISGTEYTIGSAYAGSGWALANSGLVSTNPSTSAAWTWSEIDNLIAGIRINTGEEGILTKCSQLYIVVSYTVPATIDSFTATPENIEFGRYSLLAWETTGSTTVMLSNGIGIVGVDGSRSVTPSETTTYTLTASNISGTVYDYVTVTVIPSSNKISMADIAGSFPNRGLLPQLGIGKSYLEYSSDITDTYVQSLGFSFTGGDFKRPYMAKDYQSMMYLFNDTPSDISNGVRETQLSKITGSLPDRNDAYFDFSQTLASEDNFNAYAAENYRLMGKITPTASMSFSGAVESIFSDVDTNIPSKQNANLAVVSPRFSGDKYIWTGRVKDGTWDWGSLSNSSGLKTIYYTPTLTANQRNVIITLSSGGKTLAELEFMVWFKG